MDSKCSDLNIFDVPSTSLYHRSVQTRLVSIKGFLMLNYKYKNCN
jgi:hypothetical protein